jgi:hypothetical protein
MPPRQVSSTRRLLSEGRVLEFGDDIVIIATARGFHPKASKKSLALRIPDRRHKTPSLLATDIGSLPTHPEVLGEVYQFLL